MSERNTPLRGVQRALVAALDKAIAIHHLFSLVDAEVHGLQIDDLERRRTLLLAILLGDRGASFVEKPAGRTRKHWGRLLGARTVVLVTQQISQHIRRALGSDAVVAVQPSGIVIAPLPADREEAERTAQQLIQAIEATPLRVGGHRDAVAVKLACGIVAFSQTQALALAVPAAV
jgi:hypothetical protein